MDSIRSVVCWALTLVLFYFVSLNLQANADPRWPLPEGIKSAEVNGYDMAYQEAGSGPHIVLVHGALTDYRIWNTLVPAFAKRFHVIAVSLRHYYPEKWDGTGKPSNHEFRLGLTGTYLYANTHMAVITIVQWLDHRGNIVG